MMVGRDVQLQVSQGTGTAWREVVLDVEGLTRTLQDATKTMRCKTLAFQVRAGEIVCIAGIDGNGQT